MKAFACLVASALACTWAWAAPRASITLRPQVEVAADAVVLGDVAHLHSPELALIRQLVHLPIGRAPRDGQPASVDRQRLARWIQRETGLDPADFEWRGSDGASVRRGTRQLAGSELAAAALATAREFLRQQAGGGEVRVARWPRDLQLPVGEVQLRARPIDRAMRSRMLVWVDVWSAGSFVRTVPVSLEVQAAPLAAGMPLATGAAEGAAKLAWHGQDATPLLVERGGWATLRSTEGVVSLESRVAVLQDGRAGDQVRVRAPGGGAVVFARVVGPAQLELAP